MGKKIESNINDEIPSIVRELSEKEEKFFGKSNVLENVAGLVQFKQVLDNDNIIIFTSEIREYKNKLIYVVDTNTYIEVEFSNIISALKRHTDSWQYLIRLSRSTTVFKKDNSKLPLLRNFLVSEINSFDDLLKIAAEQESEKSVYRF